MENKLIPEIRFPEYKGSWSIKKFKDYSIKSGRKNSKGENYEPFSVSNKLGLINQAEQFEGSRLDVLDKESYKIVEPNDFAYNPARINVGSIAFNNLNKTVIVSSLYVVVKMSEELDNEFILQYIKSPIFNYEVRRNTEGSVREYLFYESFKNIKFPFPNSKEEQIRVGSFLKKLDEAIELHQQELTTLKQTKQGFLQKMFPKEGEFVPEVRFPGFSRVWEQRKLDSIVDKLKSYSLSRDVETPDFTGYKYIHYGDIHTKVAGLIDESSNLPNIRAGNYELLEKGDLVLADASEDYQGIATPAVITTDMPCKLVSGLHTIALRPKLAQVDSVFLYYLFYSSTFRRFGYKTGTGMKVFGISATNVLKFGSAFPSLEEQIKIGEFFKQLDETIELYEKELETLKQTKKAFLQKMFV